MITTSDPPCPNTHLTAYMDDSVLSKHIVAFSAQKLKNVVGYELRHPQFSKEEVRDIVEKWKAEGSWPNIKPVNQTQA